MQDRPRRQRHLVPATSAFPASELYQLVRLPLSTTRAHKSHLANGKRPSTVGKPPRSRTSAGTRAKSLETAVGPRLYTTPWGFLKQPYKQKPARPTSRVTPHIIPHSVESTSLRGHLKTGQSWSLQNRPVERIQDTLFFYPTFNPSSKLF